MSSVPAEILRVQAEAECLHDEEAVRQAFDRMARAITARLAGANPLLVCVMNGGLYPTGQLLPRLAFPLQLDYVHATRYRGEVRGGAELDWLAVPSLSVRGRVVLLVDDILDEGLTLKGIRDAFEADGAREVLIAVLALKRHDRNRANVLPDFVGLEVPDRYVFGCGLDYKNYLRNMPAIYAVKGM